MLPRPKSPYALQKLVGEYYCNIFSAVYGLETVALRYFNVYGPRQDPSSPYSGVLSLFMRVDSGAQGCRPFSATASSRATSRYVEDVAELNLKAARAPNVAGPHVQRRQRLPDHAERGVGAAAENRRRRDSRRSTAPERAGDVRDSQADTTAAVAELGHAPRFSFEEGMRKTLEWYRAAMTATSLVFFVSIAALHCLSRE